MSISAVKHVAIALLRLLVLLLLLLLLIQVEPAPGGCRIEHILAVKPVMDIPAYIAPYTSSIFKQQVGKLLQDLEQAIAREVAAATAAN